MRILLALHHKLDPDLGASGATINLGSALEQAGCRVDYYGFEHAFPNYQERGRGYPMRYPWKLAAFLARHARDFDVVDVSSGDCWVWARLGRPCAKRRHVLATRSHGLEHIYYRRYEDAERAAGRPLSRKHRLYSAGFRLWEVRQSLCCADCSFLLNEEDRDYARQTLRVPSAKLSVLPNGIAASFFDRPPPAPPSGECLNLAFVGRWEAQKGNVVVLDVLARLASRGVRWTLKILGAGQDASLVKAGFPDALRALVDVVPAYRNADLPGLLAGRQVLLFPSRAEGFGLALVEAMACGLVPVTTPVGVAPEVIRHGNNGLLVPIDDAGAVTEALLVLAGDAGRRRDMQLQAQEAVQRYRWEAIAARTLAIYQQTLERGQDARPASAWIASNKL